MASYACSIPCEWDYFVQELNFYTNLLLTIEYYKIMCLYSCSTGTSFVDDTMFSAHIDTYYTKVPVYLSH